MKSLRYMILFFLVILSPVFAENLPKYRIVDLGLFEMDYSRAYAINDRGQVLGSCGWGDDKFLFLWDKENGVKLIDHPGGDIYSMKLNEVGQFAGVRCLDDDHVGSIFYWDENLGFLDVESSMEYMYVVGFNAKGQILGKMGDEIFIWDHGKKTNLTTLFHKQIPGNWDFFHAVSLNSHGHVAFNAYGSNGLYVYKAFLWKNGSLEMIMPEKSMETYVVVRNMDDDGNLIVETEYDNIFINRSGNVFPCLGYPTEIINGIPTSIETLPSLLKKDRQGKYYFLDGADITKLLNDEFPYYNIRKAELSDQNSKGYVVGSCCTIVSGTHAFLAIPEIQNTNEPNRLNHQNNH